MPRVDRLWATRSTVEMATATIVKQGSKAVAKCMQGVQALRQPKGRLGGSHPLRTV